MSLNEQTITVLEEKRGATREILRTEVGRIAVARGKKRCTVKGALLGAAAGAALMALYFSGSNDLSQNSGAGDAIGGVAFFLVPPTAVGALIGTAVRQDRWVPGAASPQSAAPQATITARLTIRF